MQENSIFDLKLNDVTLAGMANRRAKAAEGHWEKEYNLKKVREQNAKLYTTEYVKDWLIDERYEDIFADNRLFTSIRTILPFVTDRITQPEVIPANLTDEAVHFAAEFEKVLVEVADEAYALDKVKLAVQDLLRGMRTGILKWVYDPEAEELTLEHCDPQSVIIDEKARLRKEPKYVRQHQKRTIAELLQQFPDKKDALYKLLNIQKGVPSQLEREIEINEDWMLVPDENGKETPVFVWLYQNTVLGKMTDPNWNLKGKNFSKRMMSPYIFFNVLNDGSGYIDHTSFIEQAQYSQKNYDKRGQAIAENAAYGGIGVPVFGKGAIKAETAAKVRFSPVQRVILDTEDVHSAFTTWNAGQLPAFMYEDKVDLRNNVDNTFGTPQIMKGAETDTPTLGQDLLVRDQAQGRQQEIIKAIDNGMSRFYELEAQFIWRYFDEGQMYNYIGDDSQAEVIFMTQDKIAKNMGIKVKVKTGSSMPVDRAQKRMVGLELAKLDRIGTLPLYKMLGVFDDADEAFKQFMTEKIYPFSLLDNADKSTYDREAADDLAVVIGGGEPEERPDISQEYVNHLNEYMLTDKFQQLTSQQQTRVKKFMETVVKKAQEKLQKLQGQQPVDNPQLHMGTIKKTENISYQFAPPDVQRQMEAAVGFQPSQMGVQAMPYQLPNQGKPTGEDHPPAIGHANMPAA